MSAQARFRTKRPSLWTDLAAFQDAGGWHETDVEARAFDIAIKEAIGARFASVVPIEKALASLDQEKGNETGRRNRSVEAEDHIGEQHTTTEAGPPTVHTAVATSVTVVASSFRLPTLDTPISRLTHSATFPHVPTPSGATPNLPKPPIRSSTSRLRHSTVFSAVTPDHIPSPVDTPGSTSSRTKLVTGEGRGRRDDPATLVPLGFAAFSKLRGKRDFQTLTKHFELFSKTASKQEGDPTEMSKVDAKRKGKGRQAGKAPSVVGLGGKVFAGSRFCMPPELGQVTKHKQRWDIISRLGGQVTLQPDTAITHVIYDGKSASLLARELGLERLSELPEGTVCVKWEWVVSCKLAGNLLDTATWLSFPATSFTRVVSMTNMRGPTRIMDITARLKGPSVSIARKRQATASDSDTESPAKRTRLHKLALATASPDKSNPMQGPAILPGVATVHALPTGLGWEVAKDSQEDGLDVMISGLKEGKIDEVALSEGEETDDNDIDDRLAKSPEFTKISGTMGQSGHNPRALAGTYKCAQKNDGTAAKGPNEWLAQKFDEMHDMYQGVQGKNPFAIRQYMQAASIMRRTPHVIGSGAQALSIKGVGQSIADRIDEFISGVPGRHFYENNDQMRTVALFKDIYGVGRTFANELYHRGARSIDDLRSKHFGLTPGQKIGLDLYDDLNARIPRAECKQLFELIRDEATSLDRKLWIEIMGSYRRGQETSGDVDILITRNTSDGLTHAGILPRLIVALREKGIITHDLGSPHDWKALEAKWMGVGRITYEHQYRRIDILCIPYEQWGAALIYFTGNDIFNRSLRLYARKKGYSLNQRGLSKDVIRNRDGTKMTEGEIIASRTEQEIFNVLGLRWRHPHHRRP